MSVLDVFATRLKEIRRAEGLTQEEMSAALGCSRMSYVYYENAKRTPDIEFLNRLQTYTGFTSEYLLGHTDNRNYDNMSIGHELGLDDNTIQAMKEDSRIGYALNYLVTHPSFSDFFEISKKAMRASASAWEKGEIGFRNTSLGNADYAVFLRDWNLYPDDASLYALQAGTLLSDMLSFGRLTVSTPDNMRQEAQKRYLKCILSNGGEINANETE